MRRVCLLTVVSLALLPRPAEACWDGIFMVSEKAEIRILEGDPWFASADVESSADALAQLDALLPADGFLLAEWGYVEIETENGECSLAGLEPTEVGDFNQLFDLVAKACKRSEREVERARAVKGELYTVQLLSTSERASAQTEVDRLNGLDCEWHGFYEEGGFPSAKPCARVETATLADGRVVHRVLVGNYLSRADAEVDRVGMEAELGQGGMVRRR